MLGFYCFIYCVCLHCVCCLSDVIKNNNTAMLKQRNYARVHRRSQGVHVHPLGGEKNEAKFTAGSCKCTPRQSKSPIFKEIGRSGRSIRLFRQF